jgi:formylglycine-generating enzyme required for sulfatase activity
MLLVVCGALFVAAAASVALFPKPEPGDLCRPDLNANPSHEIDCPVEEWQKDLRERMQDDVLTAHAARRPDLAGMVLVPGGTVVLSQDCPVEAENGWMMTAHEVTLTPFWIDRLLVTTSDYDRCVAASGCLPLRRMQATNDYPVFVEYLEAANYCAWLGKRLPTEDEWELAARGPEPRAYPWGDELPLAPPANYCDRCCRFDWRDPQRCDGYAGSSPVGAFPAGASPYGLLDMSGNMKQWVADAAGLLADEHIARGSSWYSQVAQLTVCNRHRWRPGVRLDDKGFRCAADE